MSTGTVLAGLANVADPRIWIRFFPLKRIQIRIRLLACAAPKFDLDPYPLFTLTRIRIRLLKMMWIHADPHHCRNPRKPTSNKSNNKRSNEDKKTRKT
jgi:hypothetical protein